MNVDEEAEEWLEAEADRLGLSKAEAGGRCIELMQSDAGHITLHQSESDDVDERLADLEERVDELEADLEDVEQREPTAQPDVVDERPDRDGRRDDHGAADVDADMDDFENLRDEMERELEEHHVPGRDPAVERARREAIRYAWERLREEGRMKPRDLANDVFGQFFDDPDLGYSTAGGDRHAGYQLWDNCVRDVLRDLPGVHTGREWTFHEP